MLFKLITVSSLNFVLVYGNIIIEIIKNNITEINKKGS